MFKSSSFIAIFVLMVLSACASHSPNSLQEKALFTDADIDRATLAVASSVGKLEGHNMGSAPSGATLPALPDSTGDFNPQVVLPNTDGFVFYIQHNPAAVNPWSIIRHNQATDQRVTVLTTQREVQSVAGSLDGNIIMVSMRQTTTTPNDFEIFRLNKSTQTTHRLTTDTVDNINVGVSADGLKVVWQHPANSIQTVFLRTYSNTTTTSSFSEVALSSASSQVQPSISGNGRFITLIRTGISKTVERFDTFSNSYLQIALVGRFESLEHPSVSDSGNTLAWLFRNTQNSLFVQVKNLPDNTIQDVVTGLAGEIEHPFITSDGGFISYSLKQNNTFKVHLENLTNGVVRRIANPTAPVTHVGSMWQKIPLFGHETKLLAPTSATGDLMGGSLAIDGNTMVACARGEDNSRGACHVFSLSAGVWTFVKKLQATDGVSAEFFGSAVAISGNFIVVGTPSEDHNADGVAGDESSVGAAYVFSRNSGGTNNWGQVKKLIASDDDAFDGFGNSVAIDGDFIVVGASGNDVVTGNGVVVSDQGSAYIFFRNQGGTNQWGQIKQPSHSDIGPGDRFGSEVTIDGNTVVVTAFGKDAAYVFEKDNPSTNAWGQVKKISGNRLGSDVSLDADTLAVSARQETSGGGTVSIFSRNQGGSNNWGLIKKVSPSQSTGTDFFGDSIDLLGDTLVVGAPSTNIDLDKNGVIDCSGNVVTECDAGAAYIFQRNSGGSNAWGEVRRFTASDVGQKDEFGAGVAAGNNLVAIGLPGPQGGSDVTQHPGAVYIYK